MWTIILQKKVWSVSFFVLQEFLNYLLLRLFLLLCSLRLIFFSAFLNWAKDLSLKIGKSWILLIRVSISLVFEVHSVNGVGDGAVIWVEPVLFVSVTDSFLSPKVLKLYNQCPERPDISTICCMSVFQKAIEKYSGNVSNFSSCYSWRDKWRRNEKFNCFFLVTKGDKV